MPPTLFPNIEFLLKTSQRIDTLHQPLWWLQETAFLAFLPINPDFAGVPFDDFNHAKLQRGPTGYSMGAGASLKWKHNKFILRALAQTFTDMYGMPKVKTWNRFGNLLCTETFQHPKQFQCKLKYVKGWLTLYMAILAYIMAVA